MLSANATKHTSAGIWYPYPPSPGRIVIASSVALSSAKESQANPTIMYRMLWPRTAHNGKETRHHDHCAPAVSFRTAKTTQTSPDNQNPAGSNGFATSGRLLIIVLEQPTQPLLTSNASRGTLRGSRPGKQQLVRLTLVIPLTVIMFPEVFQAAA